MFQAIGHPNVDPSLPLWGFLFLVTLGIDYSIFLMTRAREEVAKLGNREGILAALTVTGGVITSAGAVLAATFATLVVLPLVAPLRIGSVVAIYPHRGHRPPGLVAQPDSPQASAAISTEPRHRRSGRITASRRHSLGGVPSAGFSPSVRTPPRLMPPDAPTGTASP